MWQCFVTLRRGLRLGISGYDLLAVRMLSCSLLQTVEFWRNELALKVDYFQSQNLTTLLFALTVAVPSNKASTASTLVVMFNLRTDSKVFARIGLTHVLLCNKKKCFNSVEANNCYSVAYQVNREDSRQKKIEKRIPMWLPILPKLVSPLHGHHIHTKHTF